MSERFYVHESSGYRINLPIEQMPNAPLATEVLVLDRDYNHEVVWSSETALVRRPRSPKLDRRRGKRYRNGYKFAAYRKPAT